MVVLAMPRARPVGRRLRPVRRGVPLLRWGRLARRRGGAGVPSCGGAEPPPPGASAWSPLAKEDICGVLSVLNDPQPHCDHALLGWGSLNIGPSGSKSKQEYVCCWCARPKTVEINYEPPAPPIRHGPYEPAR